MQCQYLRNLKHVPIKLREVSQNCLLSATRLSLSKAQADLVLLRCASLHLTDVFYFYFLQTEGKTLYQQNDYDPLYGNTCLVVVICVCLRYACTKS